MCRLFRDSTYPRQDYPHSTPVRRLTTVVVCLAGAPSCGGVESMKGETGLEFSSLDPCVEALAKPNFQGNMVLSFKTSLPEGLDFSNWRTM